MPDDMKILVDAMIDNEVTMRKKKGLPEMERPSPGKFLGSMVRSAHYAFATLSVTELKELQSNVLERLDSKVLSLTELCKRDRTTPKTDVITTWRYSVRSVKGEGWGIFIIDSSGMFAVVSDFGNYAYQWPVPNHGKCFRSFLAQLNAPYLSKKLNMGHPMEWDRKATEKAIRETILERRRGRDLTRDEAEYEWDILPSEDFREWIMFTGLEDAIDHHVEKIPSEVTSFCERVFPRFVELLKAELAGEES